jgi:hypothetical protein
LGCLGVTFWVLHLAGRVLADSRAIAADANALGEAVIEHLGKQPGSMMVPDGGADLERLTLAVEDVFARRRADARKVASRSRPVMAAFGGGWRAPPKGKPD